MTIYTKLPSLLISACLIKVSFYSASPWENRNVLNLSSLSSCGLLLLVSVILVTKLVIGFVGHIYSAFLAGMKMDQHIIMKMIVKVS